jgi:hypothetical protein
MTKTFCDHCACELTSKDYQRVPGIPSGLDSREMEGPRQVEAIQINGTGVWIATAKDLCRACAGCVVSTGFFPLIMHVVTS